MKLFISWSGERSKVVASALRSWLPLVQQRVEPWMSDVDIRAGARWDPEIALRLKEARYGIICVTPENREETWLLFEAGALSNAVEQAHVVPYLLGMEPGNLRPPLGSFQAKRSDKEGTKHVLQAINEIAGSEAISPETLEYVFERLWPDLQAKLLGIPAAPEDRRAPRSDRELIEEILTHVRQISGNGPRIAALRRLLEKGGQIAVDPGVKKILEAFGGAKVVGVE